MCGSGPWTCSAPHGSSSPHTHPRLHSPSPEPGAQVPGVALSAISILSMVRVVCTSPNAGTEAAWSPIPIDLPLCSLPSAAPPARTSCAQNDRLPRCCLCWRYGKKARDPETQRYGKGVREGQIRGEKNIEGAGGRWKKNEETGRQEDKQM